MEAIVKTSFFILILALLGLFIFQCEKLKIDNRDLSFELYKHRNLIIKAQEIIQMRQRELIECQEARFK